MSNGDERLTLSDWVTFLSGEKSSNATNIPAVGSLVITAVAIVATGQLGGWARTSSLLAILVISYMLLLLFQSRFNKANKLLKKIMHGEIKDPLQIQKEWIDC